jgi:hypothetical protein
VRKLRDIAVTIWALYIYPLWESIKPQASVPTDEEKKQQASVPTDEEKKQKAGGN